MICAGCFEEFNPKRKDQIYHSVQCRDRAAKLRKRQNASRVLATRLATNSYYSRNREKTLQRAKRNRENLKREVFEAYGNKCNCCGEANQGFLTIDHIDGRGAEQKRNLFG